MKKFIKKAIRLGASMPSLFSISAPFRRLADYLAARRRSKRMAKDGRHDPSHECERPKDHRSDDNRYGHW
jgi:hypothetical protein